MANLLLHLLHFHRSRRQKLLTESIVRGGVAALARSPWAQSVNLQLRYAIPWRRQAADSFVVQVCDVFKYPRI